MIVLRRLERDRKNENDRLGVVLRLSPDMQRDVVRMHREVLGIGLGDNVVFEAGGKPVRIAVTDATVHLLDKDVLFRISGRRYRKDGLLGKRDEAFTLGVENDAVPKQAGNTPPYGPAPATGRPAQYPFWLHR